MGNIYGPVKLGQVQHEVIRQLLATRALGNPGFSVDTNTNDAETDNAFDYMINGVLYTHSADAAIDISADVDNLADIDDLPTGKKAIYIFEVDKDGNYTVAAGDQIDVGDDFKEPNVPNPTGVDVCPFGALTVSNSSGSDFTLGTTNTDASGVTTTFYDIAVVPTADVFN